MSVRPVVDNAKKKPTPKGGPCSFCGKGIREVKAIIAAPNRVFICNECVQQCRTVLAENGLS